MPEQEINLTEPLAQESELLSKVKKGLATVVIAGSAFLVISEAVKRYARRKDVTVTVADRPAA